MKKFLLRFSVFLITFAVALMVAGRMLNKDHDNMTMEMAEATLPVICMLWGEQEYNPLYGYVSYADPGAQRDQITILGENRRVGFVIRPYGRTVSKITAQVRSGDGTRLIENLEITEYKVENDSIRAELALKDLIEKKQEYVISIGLFLDDWQEVWYHTRAIWDEESLIGEQLAFVLDFHKTLYHREEAKSLVKYLESNSKLEDNRSFHQVNIHSSFKQITWGDLKIEETREPTLTLKEIHGQVASVQVDYAVKDVKADPGETYRMRDFYRIRYTPDRTYLLSYERTMTQIPNENAIYGGDKLLLGIGDEKVDMMENEDGTVVAFQQADRLFSYHTGTQKLALIFSFDDLERADAREELDEHEVKILNVDKDGNLIFAVYGYMNRGEREGQVGIRVCRYDVSFNTVSEVVFIPWSKPFSDLKWQLGQLLYLGEEKNLYLCLEHAVYCVDLETKDCVKVMDILGDDLTFFSEDNQILVWQEPTQSGFSNVIKVRDLSIGEETLIRANAGEALKILGFMGQDLIYGVARMNDVTRTGAGQIFFPMYKLCIVKADGTLLKEYAQDGIYVTDLSVEENQIILERVMQKENGSFVETTQDHVTKTTPAKSGKNKVSVVEIDVYEKYVQIQVNGKIDPKKVQLLTPKEVIQEGAEELTLNVNSPVRRYYVYGPKGYDGDLVSVANAMIRAEEISGSVVSEEGTLLWQKGERSGRNQIMAIHEPEKTQEIIETQAQCLDVMLRQKGISYESLSDLSAGKLPAAILRANLTESEVLELPGVSLDAMLYFVSRDYPVMALLQTGEAVLITGYNESQVVIFQPSTGKLYKKGMSDAAKWFEESGNSFLTYFP